MKFLCGLLLVLIYTSHASVPKNLYADFFKKSYTISPTEELPQELKFIISSIQQYQLTDVEKTHYIESLILLDANIKSLTKEERLFLGKSEILKTLFNSRAKLKPKKRSHNPKILNEIKLWQQNDKLSDFTKWFLAALHEDLKTQFDSPFFRQFILMKVGNRRLKEIELRKLGKRFRLLLPWYEEYKRKGPEVFQSDMKPLLLSTLQHVSSYYGLLSKYSRLNHKRDLKSFLDLSAVKIELQKKEEKKDMALLPLFPKPDPNYQPPEVLPEPVDDWMPLDDMKSLEAKLPSDLFPKADPNYKAPAKLPEPVNDWLLDL